MTGEGNNMMKKLLLGKLTNGRKKEQTDKKRKGLVKGDRRTGPRVVRKSGQKDERWIGVD